MLDKNDLELLLDILNNHSFDSEKMTLSNFQKLLVLDNKLTNMIKEMEGKQNGNN